MKIHPVKDLYEIEIANIKKRNSNQGIGLKSGYPEMDAIMGGIGFEPGFIYTIASRPGMGKTALILNLVFNQLSSLAHQDCIVYVSTKDSSTVLMQKMLAIASGIDLKKIQLGQLSDQELSVLQSPDILGKLSNDKLVEVLDVLDKLRENGRIIGIITHLEDMKTQIPLRLEVYRTEEGPSRVRMAVGGMN